MLNCHILKVKTRDIGNGPGIRVSVWVAGCSHQCDGCHNPETWKWNQGTQLTQNVIDLIIQNCRANHIRGLTLTGGDPLFPKNRKGCEAVSDYGNCPFDFLCGSGCDQETKTHLQVDVGLWKRWPFGPFGGGGDRCGKQWSKIGISQNIFATTSHVLR